MLINGCPIEQISALDRGLQYGDGLFETIAVVDGEPRLWERHMSRLVMGEERLGLPAQNKDKLLEEALSLTTGKQRAVLKIILTRGVGGRGYRPSDTQSPTRILSLNAWPAYPSEWYGSGIRLRICSTRLGRNKALSGIKHLNRLEQVVARQEWNDPSIIEGLMLDEYQQVIEGTQSNLFLVKGKSLITPDLVHAGVEGVVRDLVLDTAEELGLKAMVMNITLDRLAGADALFMTNSLLGLCPVAHLEGHFFDIQKIPSKLTERVQNRCLGFALET